MVLVLQGMGQQILQQQPPKSHTSPSNVMWEVTSSQYLASCPMKLFPEDSSPDHVTLPHLLPGNSFSTLLSLPPPSTR